MIQKPSSQFSFNGFGSIFGHHGWLRPLIDQQLVIENLAMKSYHKTSRGSVRRFEVVKTMLNSAAKEEISGYLVSGITRLKTNQKETKHLDLSLKL
ncbi:Zinc finger protein 3 [Spatholobus suberectus]|nr:Zinc finger protein 3 [Spatholobus suberectus]